MDRIQAFWQRFIDATQKSPETTYTACFHFELTKALADALLELVLKGQKKATASSMNAYQIDHEPLPEIGNLNIVTDWEGHPRCVIETTAVTILPYKDMTYDICKREGEDDSLASWQVGHQRFYEEEGKQMGYTFTEDLLVVFEDFEVIYKED